MRILGKYICCKEPELAHGFGLKETNRESLEVPLIKNKYNSTNLQKLAEIKHTEK